ncbi:MAG: peptidoglycan DD-metalloendopeptidase family protein [Erysipelotrichaceae bacterium]
MIKAKNVIQILIAALVSILIVVSSYYIEGYDNTLGQTNLQETSIISQNMLAVDTVPHMITKVYHKDQLIGVLSESVNLTEFLNTVYVNNYMADYPDSEIGLGQDVYVLNEESYMSFENTDIKILDYILKNGLFSLMAYRIEFSNGAVIYVKDIADFEQAKEQFLINFISKDAYDLLIKKQLPPELITYGTREIGITVEETAKYSKGLVPQDKILKSKAEIITFLSYGYDTSLVNYTVAKYDTVEYIASSHRLTTQQLITINSEVLQSENQILEPGLLLNIRYFDSPLNVLVTKERYVKEVVYPEDTLYVKDSSIREGLSAIQTKEKLGYKNVKYIETYINGILVKGDVSSSVIIKQPIREVVRVGTKVIPHIGSGSFRWPLSSFSESRITCSWHCYYDPRVGGWHVGLDMQYRYGIYGRIYAADRGVIEDVGYTSMAGYYVLINHNNGFITKYDHMRSRSWVKKGIVVYKGEYIGDLGNTGYSTGPHLHFSIKYYGTYYDPCRYLREC